MKIDVLLTDGHYKHTYAILRALRDKNLNVGIIFHSGPGLSFFSGFVAKRFFIKINITRSSDLESFRQYKDALIRILKKNQVDVLLPVGNSSYKLVSMFQEEIRQYTSTATANVDMITIAQDKNETFKLAEKIGIPIPRTFYISREEEISHISQEVIYPCVLKPANYHESGVRYCNNKEEVVRQFAALVKNKRKEDSYPLVQEYIRGTGAGFYALFEKGQCKAYFMHRRIHEFPITGGASTLAMSDYDEELKNLGLKLLQHLDWHGVAMVEFKKDETDNRYKLMEINPKFWGSLELSYRCGINFPYLAYRLAKQEPIPPPTQYQRNVYFRWTFPHDLLWYWHAPIVEKRAFRQLKKKIKILNNMHYDDPLTILFNLFFTVFKIFTSKKYPHGKIIQ